MLSKNDLLYSEVAYNSFCNQKYKLLYLLRQKSFFYTSSLEEIGKHALIEILDIDINESFNIVYSNFQQIFNDESMFDTIDDKQSLYIHMAREYLSLDSNPKDKLFELYEIVNADLQEISKNILSLNEELNTISKNKNLTLEVRYRRKHIQFYISKNEEAKNEIIYFLNKDIYTKAYENSNSDRIPLPTFLEVSILFGLKLLYPYNDVRKSFEAYKKPYDINDFTELDNKIGYLVPREINEIKEIYRQGNKTKILSLLKIYIVEEQILKKLLDMSIGNHILNSRHKIIEVILNHYNNKDYISVNNMLPLQIEGLFHDYCILLGIKESTIDVASLNDKLSHIDEKEKNGYSNYEYFSFVFPVIRNKVAHGRYLDDNDELQAVLLLIDLYSVFETIISPTISINKKVNTITELIACNVEGSIEYMNKLYNLIDCLDVPVPDFYKLDLEINKININYLSSNFLKYFKDEMKRFTFDIQIYKVKSLKKYLIKNNICAKQDSFIRELESILRNIDKKDKK